MLASVLSDFNKTINKVNELNLPIVLSMNKARALMIKGLNLFFFSYNSVSTLHSKMAKFFMIILVLFFTRIYNVTHGSMEE